MKKQPVAVFMYHSVGIPNAQWQWSELTIPYTLFEAQLKFLKNNGYNTIHLTELYDYVFEDKYLPDKSVVLTFMMMATRIIMFILFRY
jgi:peptidoglycan/xylan/chitin deacetylase (PgdA/CDA1 family)